MNKSNKTFTDHITHKNLINSNQYCNSSIKPPGGLFIASPFEVGGGGGGFIEKGGLFEREAYLI